MSNTKIDLIDQLLGLEPDSSTYEARHFRDKVLHGTQDSYEALFNAKIRLNLAWRYLVAIYASQLSNAPELLQHYIDEGQKHGVEQNQLVAVQSNRLEDIEDKQLRTILEFTAKLILKPIEGDKEAVLTLTKVGIEARDIVALSQLIAFLSYQIRLFAGLKAMQAWEQK
ncbi:MAG TPA: CMD domain protein [Oligella sp.]|nr:CMD domain protein [Oligella sp.]